MLLFKRPQKPNDFESKVLSAKVRIENIINQGQIPTSKDFKPKWTDFKTLFQEAQNHKCGYCESSVTSVTHGDMEHYYPKTEIKGFKSHGEEQLNSSKVRGRTFFIISNMGYWWKAYEWENYLFSCPSCNQSWKLNLFPVLKRNLPLAENDYKDEKPLLLNPFGRKKPSTHFNYGEFGEIIAKNNSKYGRATIEVCGLDRASLRLARKSIAKQIFRLIVEFDNSLTEKELITVCKRIHDLGDEEATFPGMVRTIFENKMGMKWEEISMIIS